MLSAVHGALAPDGPATVPRTSSLDADRPARRILWIDDELTLEDGLLLLLKLEGFVVDCAATAAEGLRIAPSGSYDGIIVDLRLPDGTGLSVLHALQLARSPTPSLVLTGFADYESAIKSVELGIVAYRLKPWLDDDWVDSIRALVMRDTGTTHRLESDRKECQQPARCGPERIAELLIDLRELAGTTNAVVSVSVRLARVLADAGVEPGPFAACAEALRRVLDGSSGVLSSDPARSASLIVRRMMSRCAVGSDDAVQAILREICTWLLKGHRPDIHTIGQQLALSAETIGALCALETGKTYSEWVRALAVQLGTQRVGNSPEQIAQIAYSVGLQHHAQFDREFRRMLGLSPQQFRKLLSAEPTGAAWPDA
jgi:YesN/AraC family two-component response regulator